MMLISSRHQLSFWQLLLVISTIVRACAVCAPDSANGSPFSSLFGGKASLCVWCNFLNKSYCCKIKGPCCENGTDVTKTSPSSTSSTTTTTTTTTTTKPPTSSTLVTVAQPVVTPAPVIQPVVQPGVPPVVQPGVPVQPVAQPGAPVVPVAQPGAQPGSPNTTNPGGNTQG